MYCEGTYIYITTHFYWYICLQVGEVTFFDLKTKEVSLSVLVAGCIDILHLAGLTDKTSYLLVSKYLIYSNFSVSFTPTSEREFFSHQTVGRQSM